MSQRFDEILIIDEINKKSRRAKILFLLESAVNLKVEKLFP